MITNTDSFLISGQVRREESKMLPTEMIDWARQINEIGVVDSELH